MGSRRTCQRAPFLRMTASSLWMAPWAASNHPVQGGKQQCLKDAFAGDKVRRGTTPGGVTEVMLCVKPGLSSRTIQKTKVRQTQLLGC